MKLNYGDIIIFDNRNGQCISAPVTACLLKWSKEKEKLFPINGTYWAVGIVRKATPKEIKNIRWGVMEV